MHADAQHTAILQRGFNAGLTEASRPFMQVDAEVDFGGVVPLLRAAVCDNAGGVRLVVAPPREQQRTTHGVG